MLTNPTFVGEAAWLSSLPVVLSVVCLCVPCPCSPDILLKGPHCHGAEQEEDLQRRPRGPECPVLGLMVLSSVSPSPAPGLQWVRSTVSKSNVEFRRNGKAGLCFRSILALTGALGRDRSG